MSEKSALNPNKRLKPSLRAKVVLATVAAVAIGGVFEGAEAGIKHAQERQHKMEQLARVPSLDEPYKLLNVEANLDPNSIIRRAFPDDLSDPERFYQRQRLVGQQGLGKNHALIRNQPIYLPAEAHIGQLVNPDKR